MIKRDQKGFTLIELLVVLAIIALIAIAATTTTFQVLASTKRSNDHMTAIRQVQNAGYWISNDAQMAQSVVTDDVPETPEFLVLNWTEWDEGKKKKDSKYHLVTYSFQDLSDGIGKLKRQYLIKNANDEPIGDGVTTLVAEYIYYNPGDPENSSFFEPQDGRWILRIQARKGTATETREYEVTPRVNM
ncbi:MAG: prepilin-type N-terminal cleavage/methylation domain-containing protein [Dehalococcoidia bacterium]|nr:MAG: prepilin-type N-terminal cleavage/methylation domain-containing protein [Dehalococcoidia bacterium]